MIYFFENISKRYWRIKIWRMNLMWSWFPKEKSAVVKFGVTVIPLRWSPGGLLMMRIFRQVPAVWLLKPERYLPIISPSELIPQFKALLMPEKPISTSTSLTAKKKTALSSVTGAIFHPPTQFPLLLIPIRTKAPISSPPTLQNLIKQSRSKMIPGLNLEQFLFPIRSLIILWPATILLLMTMVNLSWQYPPIFLIPLIIFSFIKTGNLLKQQNPLMVSLFLKMVYMMKWSYWMAVLQQIVQLLPEL